MKFFPRFSIIFLIFIIFFILYCPYNKVEESFNLQASHDILFHNFNLNNYDHFEYPGVVRRTFIFALLLSIIISPIKFFISLIESLPPKIWDLSFTNLHLFLNSKFILLICVRVALGISFFISILFLCFSLEKSFSLSFKTKKYFLTKIYIIICISQFHLVFYCSRLLPNSFALILINFAFGFYIQQKFLTSVAFFTITATVIRCDTAILVFSVILTILYYKPSYYYLKMLFITGLVTTIVSVLCSVLIDSFFWGQWCWPEGEVLYYNTILNKSKNWGTLPFFWYFYSALPRLLSIPSLLLIPYAIYYSYKNLYELFCKIIRIVIPIFIFIFLFSFLPHKELRFILPVLPALNIVATIGLAFIFQKITIKKEILTNNVSILKKSFIILNIICSVIISFYMLYISSYNYYGADALNLLHSKYINATITKPNIHIDNLAAISGVSRYLENNSNFIYSKEENISLESFQFFPFDFLINEHSNIQGYQYLETIYGFDHIEWSKLDYYCYSYFTNRFCYYLHFFPIPEIEFSPKLYLLSKIK